MSHEPALRFWLDYVEGRGALCEDRGDETLVLLPPPLRDLLALPEETVVTSDPEAAREDGALLLIPGHPLLDQAAEEVLQAGDVGYRRLPWPRSAPPGPADLLAKARESVAVAHGRLDAAGEPAPAYVPLLRLGAQVRYTLGDRFQEREEVWVDALSALELPEPVRRRLEAVPDQDPAGPGHPVLGPALVPALEAAHAALERRAGRREQDLWRGAQREMDSELEAARAYYGAVLESIAQRRAAAAPERQAVLDAQAEATRLEQSRRVVEIEQKFAPRHEIRPFRLHLVLAPGLHLPLCVRRGERRYPFALDWLLPAGAWSPVRCPRCGAEAPLVAGREHLGCERCLEARPRGETPEPAPHGHASGGVAAPPPQAPAAERPVASGVRGQEPRPPDGPPPAAAPSGAAEPASTTPREYGALRRRVLDAGEQLCREFWHSVAQRRIWGDDRVAAGSPLAALYRLYGVRGPLLALGLPEDRVPMTLRARTLEPDPTGATASCGELFLARGEAGGHPFTLRWHLRGSAVRVEEVLPFPECGGQYLAALSSLPAAVTRRLTVQAPPPRAPLDAVASSLWTDVLPVEGLPLVLRCLSRWWAAAPRDSAAPGIGDPRLAALALAEEVGRASGLRQTRAVRAARFGVDPRDLAEAARRLRGLLRPRDGDP